MPVLPSYRNQSIDLLHKSIYWFLYEGNTGTLWVNISKLICCISMAVSAHNLIPPFVTSSMLASWFFLASHNKLIILAITIPDFKTNFWISWRLTSTDFVLWEIFLQISGLTKVFSKFSFFFCFLWGVG